MDGFENAMRAFIAETQKMTDTAQAIFMEAGLDIKTEMQKTADTAQSILKEARLNIEMAIPHKRFLKKETDDRN